MTIGPTPWHAEDCGVYCKDNTQIADCRDSDFYNREDEEHAAHIVRCVNVHEALVAELEYAATRLWALHDNGNARRIDTLLDSLKVQS